jgi:hypothetical protein
VIAFRHADPRFPFLWESTEQPAGRWNRKDEGPVQYCADTPDGAWAEFLRHEGITTEAELQNVRRALWAIEIPASLEFQTPELPGAILKGGMASYGECQAEAARLRENGAAALRVISAALLDGEARGSQVQGGLQAAPARDGFVLVLFGSYPDLIGWAATIAGRPPKNLLRRVRQLT